MTFKMILPLLLAAGSATAEVPYGSWSGDAPVELPEYAGVVGADDTVRCMALYCTDPQPEAAYPEKTVIEPGTDYGLEIPPQEISDLIKDLETSPREVTPAQASERDARDAYWRALRAHAEGAGSIEEVESAYKHLLPYRR